MSFELCSSERVVRLQGKEYRVEAPSVGLGLQILYCLNNLKDDDDFEFLIQTLGKLNWNTNFISNALRIAFRNNPLSFAKGINNIVTQGYELPEELDKKVKEEKPKIINWSYLLARYCEVYNANPADVWFHTPFPLFLHMNGEIEGIRYRRRIENMIGVGAGMGGVKERETKKWQKIAFKTKFVEEPESNGETDPKEELERYRNHISRTI